MLSFTNYFIGGGIQIQWSQLQHNGPLFPPEYIKHNIPVIINNKSVILPIIAEEYATMYAKFIDTKYILNNVFKKNFWKDFKPTLENIQVNSLDDIDFSLIKTEPSGLILTPGLSLHSPCQITDVLDRINKILFSIQTVVAPPVAPASTSSSVNLKLF